MTLLTQSTGIEKEDSNICFKCGGWGQVSSNMRIEVTQENANEQIYTGTCRIYVCSVCNGSGVIPKAELVD